MRVNQEGLAVLSGIFDTIGFFASFGSIVVGTAFKVLGFLLGAVGTVLTCIDGSALWECIVQVVVLLVGVVISGIAKVVAALFGGCGKALAATLKLIFSDTGNGAKALSASAVASDLLFDFKDYALPDFESLFREFAKRL